MGSPSSVTKEGAFFKHMGSSKGPHPVLLDMLTLRLCQSSAFEFKKLHLNNLMALDIQPYILMGLGNDFSIL